MHIKKFIPDSADKILIIVAGLATVGVITIILVIFCFLYSIFSLLIKMFA